MYQNTNLNFKPLFSLTRFLTLIMLILIPIQIIIYIVSPPPETVRGFFELYQQNPFLGLLSLDFLYIFNNIIIVFIYLSLYLILCKEKPTLILIALIMGLIGVSCYFPSNPTFEMLDLSRSYFISTPENQNIYLATGETLMAGYSGTTFNVYYVLSTISLLLFSYTLFKSPNFKKSFGTWGLISGFFMIIPSSAGTLGMIFSLLSLIPWIVFIILLMINLKTYH